MKRFTFIFITISALAAATALVLPAGKTPVAASAHARYSVAKLQSALNSTLAQVVPGFEFPASNTAWAEGGVLAKPVRIAAVRGGTNYGWIQLPSGSVVDVVRIERDHLIVRYDETLVRIPQSAARSGAVILRTPAAAVTQI
jgi:hypothetical protein